MIWRTFFPTGNGINKKMKIENLKLKIIVLVVAFLFLPTIVSAATLIRPPNNLGLVGFWSFNEGAGTQVGDYSGNGNTGTISGSTWTDGRLGKALNFDGVDDVVVVPASSSLNNTSPITISVWINPRSDGETNGSIIEKSNNDTTGFRFRTQRDHVVAGTNQVGFRVDYSTTDLLKYTGSNFTTFNEWQHLVVTWDGTGLASGVKIFRNGVEASYVSSQNSSGTRVDDSGNDIRIGNRLDGSVTFDGHIDDLRFYNRVLSESEVATLYRSGSVRRSTPTNLGLIAHWSFNEGEGAQAGDYSGNGNTGTLTNGPTWTDGRFGKALSFNGTNNYVSAGDIVDRSSGTMSFWFKPNTNFNSSSATSQGLWGKYESSSIDFTVTLRGTDFSAGDGTAGTIQSKFEVGGSTTYLATSRNNWNAGEWYHYMITWGGGNTTVYINGVQENTVATSRTVSGTGADEIGRSFFDTTNVAGGGPGYFNGVIDDFRMYSRILSADERAVLFRAGGETKFNTTPTNFLTDGLVGHWTFDGKDMNWTTGTLSDKSLQGNNGQVVNMSTTTTPTIGKIGQAFDFDGVNDSINVGTASPLDNLTQMTISMWVYPRTTGGGGVAKLLAKGSGLGVNQWQLSLIQSGGNCDGTVSDTFFFSKVNSAGSLMACRNAANSSLTYNAWQQIVATWDGTASGSSIKLYKDGAEVSYFSGGASAGGSASTNSGDVYIGNRSDGTRSFDGGIDEVRLYNRVLSASEIQKLYLMGK